MYHRNAPYIQIYGDDFQNFANRKIISLTLNVADNEYVAGFMKGDSIPWSAGSQYEGWAKVEEISHNEKGSYTLQISQQ